MYVNHVAKLKGRLVSLPKVPVGVTDCINATLVFNMEYDETTCDKVDGHCNDQCWCTHMKALCAPRCTCPNQMDEDDWDCTKIWYSSRAGWKIMVRSFLEY